MKKFNYLIAMAIAAFTFTSCEDVPEPFGQPINPNKEEIVIEPTGSGTEADPYNVAKVTEVTKAMADGEVKNDVYTKGYICQIDEIDITGTYGNSTYWISDDAEGKSGKYEVYRGVGLGGQKFNEAGATIIKVGDAVVIKGNIKNFKGTTPEYDSGSIIVELNGVKAGGSGSGEGGGESGGESGDGTAAKPYNVAAALAKAAKLPEIQKASDANETNSMVDVVVSGIITNIKSIDTGSYGNAEYTISDDASGSNALLVYRGYGLNGEKFTSESIKVGDKVSVQGTIVNFKGTIEFTNGSKILSINGEGASTTPDTPASDDVKTVAQALAAAAALPEIQKAADANESNSLVDIKVKGVITNIKSIDTGSYGNAEYTISDDATGSNALLVYRGYGLNGEKFTSESIKVGDVVVVQGTIVNFKGTIEFTNGSKILSINGEGGSTTPDTPASGDIKTVAEALSAAAALPEIQKASDANESNSLVDIKVKGVITNIKSIDTGSYGNAEYTISDDASASNALLVYRGYGLNGEKFTSESIKVGDKVTVQGTIVNFKGTIEFTTGSKILSIE